MKPLIAVELADIDDISNSNNRDLQVQHAHYIQ